VRARMHARRGAVEGNPPAQQAETDPGVPDPMDEGGRSGRIQPRLRAIRSG